MADATIAEPPTDPQSIKLLAVFGAELLWRAYFASEMPQNLIELALEVTAIGLGDFAELGLAVYNNDIPSILIIVEKISKEQFLSTELTNRGIPIAEKVSVVKQATRLYRILEFLTDEFLAAKLFPADGLTIKAR